jgi:4-diphosphocytidyl-2-C-methyl-D-erythritol kinase
VSTLLAEQAPAKVNLTLEILGKRADGYHDLSSVVVFADVCDRLTLQPGAELALTVEGPTAAHAGALADNLVIKAARALGERVAELKTGQFTLRKELPAGAGLGGGSADAAAALRLLARANELALSDPRLHDAARVTGADVPVCLDPRPRVMRGIGEILSEPLALPVLPAVLVHPGVPVATKGVFEGLRLKPGERRDVAPLPALKDLDRSGLLDLLEQHGNDLERPAIAIEPAIAAVETALRQAAGCRLARMSGSGSACFGIFDTYAAAQAAAKSISDAHPAWWVRGTILAYSALE